MHTAHLDSPSIASSTPPLLRSILLPGLAIMLGQNYPALLGETVNWSGLAATYISLPLFFAIWLGYRLKHRTRFVRETEMKLGAP